MSCYKVKDVDQKNTYKVIKHDLALKVVWNLPIVLRFKCMFVNINNSKKLRWYAKEPKYDGLLRQPSFASDLYIPSKFVYEEKVRDLCLEGK